MAETDPTAGSIVREVPLDRLEPPRQDVRESRDPDGLRNLAQSLDHNGQIVPASARLDPELLPDDVADVETADLRELVDAADAVRITDGWSRYQAAEMLEWPTLRCEISRETEADTVVEQLAANTDRLEMTDHETIAAIAAHKEEHDINQADLASKIGWSQSYLSRLLGALGEPEPIVEAWANPDSPIETGHVLEIMRLDDPEDKRSVFNSVQTHDQGVTATREKVDYREQNPVGEGPTPEEIQESRRQGYQDSEDARQQDDVTASEDKEPCVMCGGEQAARAYVPLCEEDYHVISQARDAGQPLMPDPEPEPERPRGPDAAGRGD